MKPTRAQKLAARALFRPKLPEAEKQCASCPFKAGNDAELRDAWALRGRQIRAENGLGKHVADYMVDAVDGHTLAAAPDLEKCLRALLDRLQRRDEDDHGELVRVSAFEDAQEDASDLLAMLDKSRKRAVRMGGAS